MGETVGEGGTGTLRSLGELSSDVIRAMHDHSFRRQASEQEHTNPAMARANLANLDHTAPVPSDTQARLLLDTAFFGGLLEEEGRRATFTLAFVSPASVAEKSDLDALVFAKPLPLSPKRLAKLAPAAHPGATYVGVFPNAGGELEIWGLVHRGDRTFGVDLEIDPWFLRVRAHRPGTLSGHYIGGLLFLYTRGAVHFFQARYDLLGVLRERFRVGEDDGEVAQVICRLVRRLLDHGHGGALLIVTHGVSPKALRFHESYGPADQRCTMLRAAVRAYEDDLGGRGSTKQTPEKAVHERYRRERRYVDALGFVAQLTAVDGATVLDDELHLLGFGAIIVTTDAPDDIVVRVENVYTGGTETMRVSDFPGTRHRSAIQFCASQPDDTLGVALVASQDGQLSVFAKAPENRTVIALRSFELGLGI